MLAVARAAARRVARPRLSTRFFAEVVGAPSTATTTAPPSADQSLNTSVDPSIRKPSNTGLKGRIPVKENHGLYAFFRKKEDETPGDARYEVVESPESMQKQTGRAWMASELRLKSFRDLHTLWYILLRERNLLATQKEEARRMGVTNTDMQVSARRVYHCRKSMARIKAVINERRLAYEGAVKLVEEEGEAKHDAEVQEYMTGVWKQERKYLQRRKEYEARKLAKRLASEEASKQTASAETAESPVTSSPPGESWATSKAQLGHDTAPSGATTPLHATLKELPKTETRAN
ncbi:putative mitochondrial 39-S ribosomal protein L47 (MRP-L47) [Lyophyllum shimeji]|uniref:Large ribosomal subunit protein uL29m n=1 Tax=Lyophyllum shimeji TaxID=47721 RepID=A0A9P3UNV9_LYOSH|nr:putative mitochondrial 39-S ribosomal protein L47 (MRP-L47) [Lyophyllum shimeji]